MPGRELAVLSLTPDGVKSPPATSSFRVVVVLALAGMLAALQQTLVIPLIPDLPSLLDVRPITASWAVTSTLLSGAVATPIVSRLADMFGKRKMVVGVLVISTCGSVLVAVGGTFVTVTAGRALQGFAAALIPVGISIMRDALPKERVGFAVALMSATLGIGTCLGLPLSGALYGQFGFSAIFWVASAAGVILATAVLLIVPESAVQAPGRFDALGALALSGILGSALLAISKGADWGWGSGRVLGLVALTVSLLVLWVPFELRVNDPVVDLRTAARRPVLLTNLASVFVAFTLYINLFASGQQLQMPTSTGYGLGLSTTQAGLAMMPAGVAMVLLSPVSSRLLPKVGGRVVLTVGAALISIGYVFRALQTDSVLEIITGSSLVGIGAALALAAMPTLIMANVPITHSASANGLNSLMRAFGGAIASAVLAAVLAYFTQTEGAAGRPPLAAFEDMYWIAACAAVIACLLATSIPSERQSSPTSVVGGSGSESVVHGRILTAGEGGHANSGIVTVTRVDGTPVDWARTDSEGRYSVALPGSDRYLVVANARGWAPRAQVVEFRAGSTELHVQLADQLTVSGTVLANGVPVAGARVVLHRGVGEFVTSTMSDSNGRFWMPLPPAGSYVVTAIDADEDHAASVKIVVDIRAVTVDIDVLR